MLLQPRCRHVVEPSDTDRCRLCHLCRPRIGGVGGVGARSQRPAAVFCAASSPVATTPTTPPRSHLRRAAAHAKLRPSRAAALASATRRRRHPSSPAAAARRERAVAAPPSARAASARWLHWVPELQTSLLSAGRWWPKDGSSFTIYHPRARGPQRRFLLYVCTFYVVDPQDIEQIDICV